jgi:hypothetical protein
LAAFWAAAVLAFSCVTAVVPLMRSASVRALPAIVALSTSAVALICAGSLNCALTWASFSAAARAAVARAAGLFFASSAATVARVAVSASDKLLV